LRSIAPLVYVSLVVDSTPVMGGAAGSGNNGPGTFENPYVVPRTESEIKVDALLSEDAWRNALVLELNYEVRPGENVPPPVRTEVLLTYDRSQLYVAFRCYDPDPSAIRAHLSDRDRIDGDDWVGVILDTFNDERRSFDLLANPLGVQSDFIESETGGSSWDGIWDSAGRITDWGYAVEMSIPFNQLRFQRTGAPQVWGFDGVRSYPRSQSHHIGMFPRDRSNNCYLCQAVKIEGFDGASPGYNIEVSPTVTGVRTDARRDFPDGDFDRENQKTEVGVTAKWGITPNLTFSGTINPDFSQIEADALRLDINQPFALYYPERRPFFTEGADFFDTLKPAIYTRTMRNPAWGLKLTGKERGNTIGAYVVEDQLTNLIFPGSQGSSSTSLARKSTATVLRYKRDIGSQYTVGALATDREGRDYFNRVYGLDADLRFTQTDQVQLQFMGSYTQYPADVADEYGQPAGTFDDRYIAFEWDHATRTHYIWLDYDDVGDGFRADLGFIPRVGFRNAEGGYFYTWNAPQDAWWSMFRAGGEANYYEDREGSLLNTGGSLWFQYRGALQTWFYSEGYRYREAYNGLEFDQTAYVVQSGFRPTGNFQLDIYTRFGDRIDYANTRPGERILVNPYVRYNLGKRLRLAADHTYERMMVEEGRLYTANISQLRAVYQLNVRTFFRAVLQHVDYQRNPDLYTFEIDPEYQRFFTQLLFSYKVNPRTVLFLGYDDNHYGSHEYELTQSDRTLFVKLGYALVL
jgi:hypothetical protein